MLSPSGGMISTSPSPEDLKYAVVRNNCTPLPTSEPASVETGLAGKPQEGALALCQAPFTALHTREVWMGQTGVHTEN